MNRSFAHAIRSVAVLGLAAAAWTAAPAPARASPADGFSLGGGVGRYDIRIDSPSSLSDTITGYHYSADSTAYQFFAKWRFAPYLALEGQYMNLGTNRAYYGPVELNNKIDGWAPWLVGTLPLGSVSSGVVGPFELFLKAGEYFYKYRSAYISPLGVSTSDSNTYNHFVYGGGVGLVFLQRLDVRLEYDELKIQDTNRSNALWLTAAFNF